MSDQANGCDGNNLHSHSNHNIPCSLTSFIGREQETDKVKGLLATSRLVTLTGAGGIGKTRLAIHLANTLTHAYQDGIFWIDLALLTDSAFVEHAIATALHLNERPNEPLQETLLHFLKTRTVLLVLDNCEHLIDVCAKQAETLLHACPLLTLLATSRETFRLAGEAIFVVPPLALPPEKTVSTKLNDLLRYEAVQLFIERTKNVCSDFQSTPEGVQAILQICQRLDGIPLAIELAAARMNVLAVQQIANRLVDSIQSLTTTQRTTLPRHRTLQATLEWSYTLLSLQERSLLHRLTVFAGPFTLSAVESVSCGAGIDQGEALDLITYLINKSWLVAKPHNDEARYRLLEPIRQYSLEKLRATGEEPVWRGRHAEWCLALAEQATPYLKSAQQAIWLRQLETEHENLRAALAWSLGNENAGELGVRLTFALFRYWWMRNYVEEARRWFTLALQVATSDVRLQASVLNAAGFLAWWQGDYAESYAFYATSRVISEQHDFANELAITLEGIGDIAAAQGDYARAVQAYEESLIIRHNLGDNWGAAVAYLGLGKVARRQGEHTKAIAYLEESRALFQAVGDKHCLLAPLMNLTGIQRDQCEYSNANQLYQACFDLAQAIGDKSNRAWVLTAWGEVARRMGDFDRAAQLMQEGLALYQQLGERHSVALTLERQGLLARNLGNEQIAVALIEQSRQLYCQLGDKRSSGWALHNLGSIARDRRDLTCACAFHTESFDLFHQLNYTIGEAAALAALGGIEIERAHWLGAAQLFGASEVRLAGRVAALYPDDRTTYEYDVALIREQLDETTLTTAWIRGSELTSDALTDHIRCMNDFFQQTTTSPPFMPFSPFQTNPNSPATTEIYIYALGKTRVVRNACTLDMQDWTYAHAKELVFYLLAHRGATREQIGVSFWPDSSENRVRERFSTMLANARRALGREKPWIVLQDKYYRLNRTLGYWYDVEVFEAKLKMAHQRLTSPVLAQQALATRLFQEAIDLYGGDLADDLKDGTWAEAYRTTLRNKYLNALLTLGKLHLTAADYAQAVTAFQRALAHDNCIEEAYRGLMRCYAQQGERGLALRQYDLLVRALHEELDAPPSAESVALTDRIRGGEEV